MNSINIKELAQLFTAITITIFLLIIFAKPIMRLSGFLIRSIFYSAIMFILNVITASFGFTIGINIITATLCGFLGFYGVLINYITRILTPF